MPPKPKPATPANGLKPPKPLLATAPINAPWASVVDSKGKLIPYLQQTTIPNMTVCKNAQSAPLTKTARLLLCTHSDGGRLIEDNAGFTESQVCAPHKNQPRYLGLMCQLGEALAANLGIGGGGNKPAGRGGEVWDVLCQLPLKYNAYYKSRKRGGELLDLYIAGHDGGKFDSVRQFGVHLAWLASEDGKGDGAGCACKVCKEERKKVSAKEQIERKQRWAEHQGPLREGVPDWRD